MMAALIVALWFCRADTIDQDGPKPVRLGAGPRTAGAR